MSGYKLVLRGTNLVISLQDVLGVCHMAACISWCLVTSMITVCHL